MKPDLIEKLGEARDFYALTKGILSVCEPFGAVHSFRFIHNRGAGRVACIIELESAQQQPALARSLGVKGSSGGVCLEIPVRKDFQSPCKVVALPTTQAASYDQRIAQVSG
jgi:hypothetical protein